MTADALVAAQLLKRLVMAYDSDDSLDFLAGLVAARKYLGLKLADEREAKEDADVIEANGYTREGDPR